MAFGSLQSGENNQVMAVEFKCVGLVGFLWDREGSSTFLLLALFIVWCLGSEYTQLWSLSQACPLSSHPEVAVDNGCCDKQLRRVLLWQYAITIFCWLVVKVPARLLLTSSAYYQLMVINSAGNYVYISEAIISNSWQGYYKQGGSSGLVPVPILHTPDNGCLVLVIRPVQEANPFSHFRLLVNLVRYNRVTGWIPLLPICAYLPAMAILLFDFR